MQVLVHLAALARVAHVFSTFFRGRTPFQTLQLHTNQSRPFVASCDIRRFAKPRIIHRKRVIRCLDSTCHSHRAPSAPSDGNGRDVWEAGTAEGVPAAVDVFSAYPFSPWYFFWTSRDIKRKTAKQGPHPHVDMREFTIRGHPGITGPTAASSKGLDVGPEAH